MKGDVRSWKGNSVVKDSTYHTNTKTCIGSLKPIFKNSHGAVFIYYNLSSREEETQGAVGFSFECYEYILLPLANKDLLSARGLTEHRQVGKDIQRV